MDGIKDQDNIFSNLSESYYTISLVFHTIYYILNDCQNKYKMVTDKQN